MQPHYLLFATCAIACACAACLNALLKNAYWAERNKGCDASSSSNLPATATTALVLAALNFVFHVAVIFMRPLSQGGWAILETIISSWTAAFFFFMSFQQLIFTSIVTNNVASSTTTATCYVFKESLAAAFMWKVAYVPIGWCAMCCDLDAKSTPLMRRCAYVLLALCSTLDAVGSYLWGNIQASGVNVSFGSFDFVLTDQITSCISSQVIITLHLAFVSCRSRDGRAWSYAPLRFELQDAALPSQRSPLTAQRSNVPESDDLQNEVECNARIWSHLRQRLLKFQRQQSARCRVFIIPCIADHLAGAQAHAKLELTRPYSVSNVCSQCNDWLRPILCYILV
jgi:hypothetical protein